MADSLDDSSSGPESADDSNLTIRIPNPKMYMARQSQWKGRRGKPRCDHCRLNNLKCDRVLPTCNHCSWSRTECKYTPLPTPAHRGIPRCDRCRLRNLKCDRNLPVCNHCEGEEDAECNYTPKKRHKVPTDHVPVKERPIVPYASKTASFLVSDMPGSPTSEDQEGSRSPQPGPSASGSSHVFESEMRTEPQIRQYVPPHTPPSHDADMTLETDVDLTYQQVGPSGNFTWVPYVFSNS